MLAVKEIGGHEGDEELRAVGARASVGHGQQEGLGVLHLEVLVGELVAVDGLTASAVAAGEVATLVVGERRFWGGWAGEGGGQGG